MINFIFCVLFIFLQIKKKMLNKFIIILFLMMEKCSTNFINDEINCLNDLSLTELIRIRKSIDDNFQQQCDSNGNHDSDSVVNSLNSSDLVQGRANDDDVESRILYGKKDNMVAGSAAMPLISGFGGIFNKHNHFHKFKDLDRSYEQSWHEEKPSKLQTVFHLSVTALSFLAFGGYLLCMIVQAIKSKGTTYYHPVATAATQTAINSLKKIKIYRRQRRNVGTKSILSTLHSSSDTGNSTRQIQHEQMAQPNPDDLYKVLVLFAEGYVSLTN